MFYDISLKKMKEIKRKEKPIRAVRILEVDNWGKTFCPERVGVFHTLKEVRLAADALALTYSMHSNRKSREERPFGNWYSFFVWKHEIIYRQEYIWSAKFFIEQHLHLKWEPDEKDNRSSRKEVL